MAFQKRTATDIVKEPDSSASLPPAGLYSVVLLGHEISTTRAGQARMDLHFSPLAKPGKPTSVDAGIEFSLMLLGDSWEDEEAFKEDKRMKLADKRKVKPSQISDEMVADELQATRNRSQRQMYQIAKALLGADQFPDIPRWNRDSRAFFDSDGNSYTRDQKDELYNQAVAQGCSTVADLANGDLDLQGYVCVARVAHETFMEKTSAKVKSLFEECPDGEQLVPATKWQ